MQVSVGLAFFAAISFWAIALVAGVALMFFVFLEVAKQYIFAAGLVVLLSLTMSSVCMSTVYQMLTVEYTINKQRKMM